MDTQTTAPESSYDAHQRIAASLYPEPVAKPIDQAPNEAIRQLRASEGRGPGALYRDDLQMGDAPRKLALAVDPTLAADAIEGQASIVASILTDIGMNRDDIERMAVEAGKFTKNRPTEAEMAANVRTAMQSLREENHGNPEAFDEALKGAKALAQRDPRLSKFLHQTGLGSHPWVVTTMARLAQTERNAKTLRK